MKNLSAFLDKQFLHYVLIGIFNTLWGYALIFFLMYVVHLSPVVSNASTYSLGLFVTYFLNRKITFKSKNKINEEFLRFIIVYIIAYSANLLMLLLCIDVLQIHEALSQIIASGVYVVTSFVALKLFVYATKNKKNGE